MAATGRNGLVTGYVTAIIAEADDTTYPNLADLTAKQVKYSTGSHSNVKALLPVDNVQARLGLLEDEVGDKTIGGHQFVQQKLFLDVFVFGADTETDQKKAVTIAEEFELWMYNNRDTVAGWWLAGRRMTRPVWWGMSGNLVRTYFMEFMFNKLGDAGVP